MTDDTEIKKLFCETLGLKESDVSDTTAYNSIEAWDSLKHLELVARLEETFKFEMDMDDIIAMENFGKIKDILKKYQPKS
jgi:acyl carrier protein